MVSSEMFHGSPKAWCNAQLILTWYILLMVDQSTRFSTNSCSYLDLFERIRWLGRRMGKERANVVEGFFSFCCSVSAPPYTESCTKTDRTSVVAYFSSHWRVHFGRTSTDQIASLPTPQGRPTFGRDNMSFVWDCERYENGYERVTSAGRISTIHLTHGWL